MLPSLRYSIVTAPSVRMRMPAMTSDALTVPRRTGGLTAYYVGENTEGTEPDVSWDEDDRAAIPPGGVTRNEIAANGSGPNPSDNCRPTRD